MSPYLKLMEQISEIEQKIGYQFQNKSLLVLAFVHRSYYNEHRNETEQHNERLEFLGDSVLGLIISEYLYSYYPLGTEGQLSHLRAYIVEAAMCAFFLQKLEAADFILLGKGEKMNDGKKKESIQSDLFEAIMGAIYLDGGLDAVKQFFWSHFTSEIEENLKEPLRNWKADLQDYSQKKHQKPPFYKVLREYGPDHNKKFEVAVYLEEQEWGKGTGSSKKEAEQQAAKEALLNLEQEKNG
jgi:ribonuclease III